ncbi:MAG: protein kinase [Pirellulaceae bacterium]|nr:protein kinase [Pirellulaceae bacterium]
MSSDRTQQQSPEERDRAQHLSLERTQPPTDVPGCDLRRFIGAGAYGEVWAGKDRNTGRQVAVKFYLHRGGVDWSLLSREVEKLVFLSADRYVVQLLDVGWDADPPYYVMEYIENGSLEDLLRKEGPLPLPAAVEMFREIAVGLVHAHGKGVLHCDLKPANVLLDQDRKPRLADFGQSRLSHEQTPALGTLFYMAPEQADLEAVPDARWDVYALGAILHCMLTGQPPYRNAEAVEHIDTARNLPERLARYQQVISTAPKPAGYQRLPGMDRALVEIVQRCLAIEPLDRYANVQEILEALRVRDAVRARRPLMVLGILGPILLLLVMALFGWRGYRNALKASETAVGEQLARGNQFAAYAVAQTAAGELEQYFRTVERVAADREFHELVVQVLDDTQVQPLLERLSDPVFSAGPSEQRQALVEHAARQPLQSRIDAWLNDPTKPSAASWFFCDPRGTQIASSFGGKETQSTLGRNFGWRTYFHGGPSDLVRESPDGQLLDYLPPGERRLSETHLSAPFQSTATNLWKVAISTPVYQGERFLGVVAMTVNLGVFVEFPFEAVESQFAVLVDGRPGEQTGMILQHPLFNRILRDSESLPDRFTGPEYRVPLDSFQGGITNAYRDPMSGDELGADYRRSWVAAKVPVLLQRRNGEEAQGLDTGLVVVVQEDYESALVPVRDLGRRLVREGVSALAVVIGVVFVLWFFVLRLWGQPVRRAAPAAAASPADEPTPLHERATLVMGPASRPPRDA